jgi:hypothetical protein
LRVLKNAHAIPETAYVIDAGVGAGRRGRT